MPADARVMIIGLDGMPPWLIESLAEEGALPHLAKLRERGVFGSMRSTVNTLTASAWPSMFTGVNPGRHGMFNFVQYVPEQRDIFITSALHRQAGALWDLVGEDGGRSAVLRVPMTFPTRPMAGIMVGDHFTPSPRHPEFTWPRELRSKMIRRFGLLGWGTKADVRSEMTGGRLRRLLHDLRGGARLTFDLVDYALERGDYRHVFAVVSETDTLLHSLAPLLRRTGPSMQEDLPERARADVVAFFGEVDERIGRLVERLNDSWNVLVVSDHGLGPNDPGEQLLRSMLIALGYQGWREPAPAPAQKRDPVSLLRRIKSGVARRIPWQVRRLLDPISLQRREQGARENVLDVIDWDNTRAFSLVSGGSVGEIWLNCDEGPAREELIGELTEPLTSAVNTRTGLPQIERVIRREEAVSGPHSHRIPDLLVEFREDEDCVELTARRSDGREVTVNRSSTGSWDIAFVGFHTRDGIFMAAGPGVQAVDEPIHCEIADVMPTAAYLMGCPIPEGLDGRLLTEIIEPGLLEATPPRVRAALPPPEWAGDDAQYSDEDRRRVERRLSDLGYL